MSEERTPTIEQKSEFSAKTKEGSDVQFEAILKFYVNPSGDVRVTAPGSGSSAYKGEAGGGGGAAHKGGGNKATSESTSKEEGSKDRQGDSNETKSSDGKFQSSKEIDKQIPRKEGDCPIPQFVPDPCKAVDDVVSGITGLFGNSSSKKQTKKHSPCPTDVDGTTTSIASD